MVNQKNMVELFSGTKKVSTVFHSHGYNITTVDSNPKLKPSICTDILDLQRNDLPGAVQFIWASPDCTCFSRAGLSNHWKKKVIGRRLYSYLPLTPAANISLLLLQKTIEILSWFPDTPFIIENPVGKIQHFPQMKNLGHNRYFVNYASFGHPHSKETYLFTNMFLPFSTKKYKIDAPGMRSIRSPFERSKVPPALVETIFTHIF